MTDTSATSDLVSVGQGRVGLDRLRTVVGSATGLVGTALVILVCLAAAIGPLVSPHDPVGGALVDRMQPPSLQHWLGTDLQGRDELTRVLYGARITLFVGVLAVLFGGVVGCSLVCIGVLGGRYVDGLLMRIVDVMLAFPNILLAIAVVAALGRGLPQLMIAIGIAQVGNFARLLRSRIVSVQELDYVVAARAVGVKRTRLLMRHLLPNSITPVLVYAPLALANAVVSIAGLGFLGLGPPDPRTPEWGSMLTESTRFLRDAPYLLIAPGGAIVASVMGFNLLGDALREALDPKLRR